MQLLSIFLVERGKIREAMSLEDIWPSSSAQLCLRAQLSEKGRDPWARHAGGKGRATSSLAKPERVRALGPYTQVG